MCKLMRTLTASTDCYLRGCSRHSKEKVNERSKTINFGVFKYNFCKMENTLSNRLLSKNKKSWRERNKYFKATKRAKHPQNHVNSLMLAAW